MDPVLDSARATFAELGVEAAGIDELRAATGKSVGSLYHRFGSKEGIAAAVYADSLAHYQAAVSAELRRADAAEAGVKAVVRRHLAWHESGPERARFLHENGGIARREPGRSLVAEQNAGFFAEVGGWWRERAAAGELRDLPFDLAYVLWLGAAQEYCRLWLAGATRVGMRAAKRTLAEGAWNAIRDEGSG